ncbi:Uma2 family endonuclease [candidate division KSB1 bacterium]|nr:Uma2 family endonuclease [candidate division KSB1 bacterium]
MSAQPKPIRLSTEEYLARERRAEFKSEYFNGELFAMAGAQQAHNLIVGNLLRTLGNQLVERDCKVYPSDMRVKIAKINKYTYPDVVVTCGKENFEDAEVDTLLNPVVIFEILSDSTEAYDRGKKFQHYQFLESLSEYVLISQDAVRVEQYIRQSDKTWQYSQYQELGDLVKLESVNCELALKDVYVKVEIESNNS